MGRLTLQTSKGEKSWLTKKAKPPTGTTRNSTLNVSWFPSYVALNLT